MIPINQAQLNTVVATCSRNKQLTGTVYYLWTTNLNPITAFDVVYEGMANVIGTNPVYNDIVSYSGTSSSQIFKVYQG